jgi:hypothetical protein
MIEGEDCDGELDMAIITSVQQYSVPIGPVTATGFLFLTEPFEDSFTHGTLAVLGLVEASFAAMVDGSPVCINLIGIVVCIKFDFLAREFVGAIRESGSEEKFDASADWQRIVSLR